MTSTNPATGVGRELVITRTFSAPRELVFQMWTDPVHLSKWWSPKHFTNPVCKVDACPGGSLNVVMQDPAGAQYPMTGTFQEVDPPKRLVFTAAAIMDEYGKPNLVNRNTVTFEEENGKTKLTLVVRVMEATELAAQPLAGMEMGWNQSLDKLEDEVRSLAK